MTRNIVYVGCLVFLLIFCSRSDSPTEASKEFVVSGYIKIHTTPVADAPVQIDQVLNWKATTNAEGYFEIKNVTDGQHILKSAKHMDNGQVVSIESTISVKKGNTDLGEIRLPVPPLFYDIDTSDISQNKLNLTWSSSRDPEFREYKVYRKDNAGIDETTGELVYVSTNINDTSFVDESFVMGLHYFYRVYILSALGKMGGSNVVNLTTPKLNYITNSGFELPGNQSIPVPGWESCTNIFSLDSTTVYNGKYSLKADKHSMECWDCNIDQEISTTNFIPGKTYKFSVYMKSANTNMGAFIFYQPGDPVLISLNLKHAPGADWQLYSTDFQIPDNVSVIAVRLYISGDYEQEYTAWFDDVVIELK